MNITKHALKKGIDLYFIRDEKFKTYMASVLFHRPLNREGASKGALLAQVLRCGNELHPSAKEIDVALEELYGASLYCSSGKRGEEQVIRVAMEAVCDAFLPAPAFDKAMELLFAAAFKGNNRGSVEQEKKNLIDRIRGQINDKRYYASLRLNEIMFDGRPYGINSIGYEEDVEKITPDDLFGFYDEVINTSAMSIIFTGNFDEAAAMAAAKKAVEALPEREAGHTLAEITGGAGEVRRVTEHLDVTQGKLAMGLYTGIAHNDPLIYAQMVMNGLYGGSVNSKLFNNVRERLSLCYYASSRADRMMGVMTVSSGIEFQNFDAAYNEIMAQLQAMKDGDFSDEEIDVIKKEICNSFRSRVDAVEALEDYYTTQILLGSDVSIEETIENIENVTREQIKEAAGRVALDTVYFLAGKEEA
ncbi:MAG: insulinase family protein [Oscillospiraceae bacterium]|nr:insulinase family protein [Oscillospiraceae bacterium]